MTSLEDKVTELREGLRRTEQHLLETADGWVPFWLAAQMLGETEPTFRRIMNEDDTPLRFRPCGRGTARKRLQVSTRSIALLLLKRELSARIT